MNNESFREYNQEGKTVGGKRGRVPFSRLETVPDDITPTFLSRVSRGERRSPSGRTLFSPTAARARGTRPGKGPLAGPGPFEGT